MSDELDLLLLSELELLFESSDETSDEELEPAALGCADATCGWLAAPPLALLPMAVALAEACCGCCGDVLGGGG